MDWKNAAQVTTILGVIALIIQAIASIVTKPKKYLDNEMISALQSAGTSPEAFTAMTPAAQKKWLKHQENLNQSMIDKLAVVELKRVSRLPMAMGIGLLILALVFGVLHQVLPSTPTPTPTSIPTPTPALKEHPILGQWYYSIKARKDDPTANEMGYKLLHGESALDYMIGHGIDWGRDWPQFEIVGPDVQTISAFLGPNEIYTQQFVGYEESIKVNLFAHVVRYIRENTAATKSSIIPHVDPNTKKLSSKDGSGPVYIKVQDSFGKWTEFNIMTVFWHGTGEFDINMPIPWMGLRYEYDR